MTEKYRGGSNTPAHIINYETPFGLKSAVVKQLGSEPNDLAVIPGQFNQLHMLQVWGDVIRYRQALQDSGFLLPNIYAWQVVPDTLSYNEAIEYALKPNHDHYIGVDQSLWGSRLLTIEQNRGAAFPEAIKDGESFSNWYLFLLQYLGSLPTSVPIDSHIRNFTLDEEGISFVDFYPPKLREYEKDVLRGLFPRAFRQKEVWQELKHLLYYTPTGRQIRLSYSLLKERVPIDIKRIIKANLDSLMRSLPNHR